MKRNSIQGFSFLTALFSLIMISMSGMSRTNTTNVLDNIFKGSNLACQSWACQSFNDISINRTQKSTIEPYIKTSEGELEIKDNEEWWGYFDGDYENNTGLLGVESAGDYSCCVKIISASEMGMGKTIEGFKFSFPSLADIDNVYIWISEDMPAKPEEATITAQKVDVSTLTDLTNEDKLFNEIRFDSPFTIADKDVYVGYSFTVKNAATEESKQPILISKTPETTDNGALYFIAPGEQWTEMSGYPFGNLAVQILMSHKVTENAVSVQAKFDSDLSGKKGTSIVVPLDFMNEGLNGCSEFSYVVENGTSKSEENTIVLDKKVEGVNEEFEYNISIPLNEESGKDTVIVTITKVNGLANESVSHTKCCGNMYALSKESVHNVFVEYFVGTWDGHSPRAYVGMDRIKETYGDRVVVASVHAGNVEKMECADYKDMSYYYKGTSGFPTSFIDRTYNDIDPYWGNEFFSDFGFEELFLNMYNKVALAEISVEGTIDEDGNTLNVVSNVEFLCDDNDADYGVGYVLTEDEMSGEGKGWDQENQMPDFIDAEIFDDDPRFNWWMNEEYVVKGYKFKNVAIAAQGMLARGIEGSLNAPFEEGKLQTHSITFNLADYPVIQDKSKLKINAVVFDRNTGCVINACSSSVGSYNSITDVIGDVDAEDVERYTLDGTRINTPIKGINIVKYSDGSVKKVVVR